MNQWVPIGGSEADKPQEERDTILGKFRFAELLGQSAGWPAVENRSPLPERLDSATV